MCKAYKGKSIENGSTSIKGRGASPAVRWLVKKGLIRKGMRVLDYGAGKFARNADYLRKLGCKVYAYDPHNYNTTSSGFKLGAVTKRKPRGKFDVAFTSFVLNVVPAKVEREIMREVESYADCVFHVHRNQDILQMATNALFGFKSNKWIVDWFQKKYWRAPVLPEGIELFYEVDDFCHYGFQTGKGKFQRLPKDTTMHRRGYRVVRELSGYVVWADKRTHKEVQHG